MIYYRRYVGDYLKDTPRLSLLEHGAYTIMLDYYYAEERPLPDDLDALYRMCRAMLPEERRAVDKILTTYFKKQDDGHHNDRADDEIAKASVVIENARENGKLGGRPKRTETQTVTEEVTETVTQNEPGNNHPSIVNHHPSTAIPQPSTSPIGEGLLPTNIPYKEIVGLYNANMTGLSRVVDLTNDRRKAIRIAWQATKKRQTLKFWKAYFEECSEDDFLNGTGPYGKGHENWRPDFEYLMRSKVITKVYEKAVSRGA